MNTGVSLGYAAASTAALARQAASLAVAGLSLGCVIATIGLIMSVSTFLILLRGGYGPFLRTLMLGTRARRDTDLITDGDDAGLPARRPPVRRR